EPGDVENIDGIERGTRHAAGPAVRRHRADIDAGIGRRLAHAHAVAEDSAARIGAGRVDGDNADPPPRSAQPGDKLADQRRFTRTGNAGDADDMRAAGETI